MKIKKSPASSKRPVFYCQLSPRESLNGQLVGPFAGASDKYRGDFNLEGSMCGKMETLYGVEVCRMKGIPFHLKPRKRSIISTLLWLAIAGILLTTLLSGCADPAWAEGITLTASFYDVASLKRDGQWDITHGRTASGQLFTDSGLTAASWDFPLGTKVKVTRTDTKASVVVLVNDRTARRFKGKRIDLSRQSFIALVGSEQGLKEGLLKVSVERI